MVDRAGSGKDQSAIVGKNRVRELFPVHHVLANRVAPDLTPHLIDAGVVLEKEMVLTIVVDHAVGIVERVFTRGEVELRATSDCSQHPDRIEGFYLRL